MENGRGAEIHRVLKPGGRMLVSDIVAEDLPEHVRKHSGLYASCISGPIQEDQYLIRMSWPETGRACRVRAATLTYLEYGVASSLFGGAARVAWAASTAGPRQRWLPCLPSHAPRDGSPRSDA